MFQNHGEMSLLTPASRPGARTRSRSPFGRFVVLATALALLWSVVGDVTFAGKATPWEPLIARLAADGFDRASLERLYAAPDVDFDPSIMARKVDSMVLREFEPRPKPTRRTLDKSPYRKFFEADMLGQARRFMDANAEAFRRAAAEYGPPEELIAAIILVETKMGAYLGKQKAFVVLSSLALADSAERIRAEMTSLKGSPERLAFADRAAKDRSDWAYRELVALLTYAKDKNNDPLRIPGSIYGAIGICQFMPTNALKYGVDADRDGAVDLFSATDAILSVGNYLRAHGWKPGLDEEGRKAVVFAYNHSDLYVLAVVTLAERLKTARTGGRS